MSEDHHTPRKSPRIAPVIPSSGGAVATRSKDAGRGESLERDSGSTSSSSPATRAKSAQKAAENTVSLRSRRLSLVEHKDKEPPTASRLSKRLSLKDSPKVKPDTTPTPTSTTTVSRKRERSVETDSAHAHETSTPKRRRAARKKTEDDVPNNNDFFCWVCYEEGVVICCELCPRVYHIKCLNMEHEPQGEWVCPECEQLMRAECTDTRSTAMAMISVEQLCLLLKFALQRMKCQGSEQFQRPVDMSQHTDYAEYVFHPVDLSMLERNIKKRMYGSTEAFLSDAKWILHNCIVFNGKHHKLTNVAKTIVKICKHEMNEIEICPDCYFNSCTKRGTNWFCEPCRIPHPLVWAKMRGYPFWPAKALRTVKDQVDCRFFGEHDRAWVHISSVYLLSREVPGTSKKNVRGMDQSMAELEEHILRIRRKFGSFEYAPTHTTYNPESKYMQTIVDKSKTQLETASEMGGKDIPLSPSAITERQPKPAGKSMASAHSSSNMHSPKKLPEKAQKSVASRTAHAVKNKYKGISAKAGEQTSMGALARKLSAVHANKTDDEKSQTSTENGSDEKDTKDDDVLGEDVKNDQGFADKDSSPSCVKDSENIVSTEENVLSTEDEPAVVAESTKEEETCVSKTDDKPEETPKKKTEETTDSNTTIEEKEVSEKEVSEPEKERDELPQIQGTIKDQSNEQRTDGEDINVEKPQAEGQDNSAANEKSPATPNSPVKLSSAVNKSPQKSGVFMSSDATSDEQSLDDVIAPMTLKTAGVTEIRAKLPNKSILNKIEEKVKKMTEEQEKSTEIDTDRCETIPDEEREKEQEKGNDVLAESQATPDNEKIADENESPSKAEQTTPAVENEDHMQVDKESQDTTETEQDHAKVTPEPLPQVSPEKNPFLAKVVESCKEKLGISNDELTEEDKEEPMEQSSSESDSEVDEVKDGEEVMEVNSDSEMSSASSDSDLDKLVIDESGTGMRTPSRRGATSPPRTGKIVKRASPKIADGALKLSVGQLRMLARAGKVDKWKRELQAMTHTEDGTEDEQERTGTSGNKQTGDKVQESEKKDADSSEAAAESSEKVQMVSETNVGTGLEDSDGKVGKSSSEKGVEGEKESLEGSSEKSSKDKSEKPSGDSLDNQEVIHIGFESPGKKHTTSDAAKQKSREDTLPGKNGHSQAKGKQTEQRKEGSRSPSDKSKKSSKDKLRSSKAADRQELLATAQSIMEQAMAKVAQIQDRPSSASSVSSTSKSNKKTTQKTKSSAISVSTVKQVPAISIITSPSSGSQQKRKAPCISIISPNPSAGANKPAESSSGLDKRKSGETEVQGDGESGPVITSVTGASETPTRSGRKSAESVEDTSEPEIVSGVSVPVFSDVTKSVNVNVEEYTSMIMNTVKEGLSKMAADIAVLQANQEIKAKFEQEIEKMKWGHMEELKEIKHNAAITIEEIRTTMEELSKKAVADLERKHEKEIARLEKQVADSKKQQWCAKCNKEAMFYCCWNTSYCGYNCQEAHWPEHMKRCTQSQNNDNKSPDKEKKKKSTTAVMPKTVSTVIGSGGLATLHYTPTSARPAPVPNLTSNLPIHSPYRAQPQMYSFQPPPPALQSPDTSSIAAVTASPEDKQPTEECDHRRRHAFGQRDWHPLCPRCTYDSGGTMCLQSKPCSFCEPFTPAMWKAYKKGWASFENSPFKKDNERTTDSEQISPKKSKTMEKRPNRPQQIQPRPTPVTYAPGYGDPPPIVLMPPQSSPGNLIRHQSSYR